MENSPLIDSLAADLEPVTPPRPLLHQLCGWVITIALVVVGISLIISPMRENAFAPLFESSRYLLEALIGILLVIYSAFAALTCARPGFGNPTSCKIVVGALLMAWFGLILYGMIHPALTPSHGGYRTMCVAEVFAYAVPGFAFLILTLRKGVTFERRWAGAFIGFAACGAPAVLMQFACVYDPTHNLIFHVTPVLLFGGLGAWLGSLFLPKI